MRRCSRAVGGLLLVLAAPALALAQSNDEIQTGIQLELSTPGARSLALGGAFVGLADDATAAYSNPAGLVQMIEPEASVEARSWAFRSHFTERGHRPRAGLTGIGIDVVDGLAEGEEENTAEAISFASYLQPRDRWAFALYHHRMARFRASLETQGPFVGPRAAPFRSFPATSELALDITGWGAAAALRVNDSLSVGLGLAGYRMELDSLTGRYLRRGATGDPLEDSLTGAFFGPADFSPDNLFNLQTQTGRDEDFALHAGVLWRLDSRWSLGAVFRQGPDFEFEGTYIEGPAGVEPGRIDPDVGGRGVLHIPDVAAIGVAFHATDRWLVTFDYDFVAYSALTDDLLNLTQAARGAEDDFTTDDAHQLHLGSEYQLLDLRYPLSIRLGLWNDPDHKIRYDGADGLLATRFRSGQDQLHLAGGLGVVVGRTQIDLAVDHADLVTTVSVSAVTRF